MPPPFASLGCDIVTGGGPGLLQAANEGANSDGAPGSMGIRVELPLEYEVNPFVEQALEHETFFTRLHHFVIASDAFVVVPDGIGTVLEMLMIWLVRIFSRAVARLAATTDRGCTASSTWQRSRSRVPDPSDRGCRRD